MILPENSDERRVSSREYSLEYKVNTLLPMNIRKSKLSLKKTDD